jgi:hypothetical protein
MQPAVGMQASSDCSEIYNKTTAVGSGDMTGEVAATACDNSSSSSIGGLGLSVLTPDEPYVF